MLRHIHDEPGRRRLVGVVLLLAGLVIAALVLIPRSDGPAAVKAPPPLPATVSVPGLGLAFSYPASWKRQVDGRTFRLRSPEGSVILTVASPVAGRRPARVKEALKAALRRRLAPAKVLRDGPGRLGTRKATSFELTGRSGGEPVRALVVVDDTPFRTYAITLVTSASPSGRRLEEAQGVIGSVRLIKPR
ncbi:MAG: hypothetical protein M3417_08540 [Actinomycetota bacterium]|nr:hypothetical protein [Actinomycetota bacterium]